MKSDLPYHHRQLLLILLLGLFTLVGCSEKRNAIPRNMKNQSAALEVRVLSIKYAALFQSGDSDLLEEIWDKGQNESILRLLVSSSDTDPYARFLAHEILVRKVNAYTPEKPMLVANAYTEMLQRHEEQVGLSANSWGLLYNENDAGVLGNRLVELEEASIPYLYKLLDDSRAQFLYEGSEEALIGDGYQYRVKDFAAYYLHLITKVNIDFYSDIEQRNKEIQRFKSELSKKLN